MESFSDDYTRIYRMDKSIEGFWIESDLKKWPLRTMGVDH